MLSLQLIYFVVLSNLLMARFLKDSACIQAPKYNGQLYSEGPTVCNRSKVVNISKNLTLDNLLGPVRQKGLPESNAIH